MRHCELLQQLTTSSATMSEGLNNVYSTTHNHTLLSFISLQTHNIQTHNIQTHDHALLSVTTSS
jgi:hypothetical protein